jgi:hypothetical protein
MAFGNEGGENVSFKHNKNRFFFQSLRNIYICQSNVFACQKPFVEL